MTELKRPASIRELAEQLPRTTLIYLCELRSQPVSPADEDCVSSIARSFRGQRDDFLGALEKDDLEILFGLPIRDKDSLFKLPHPEVYTEGELRDLATRAFGAARGLGTPFVPISDTGSDEHDDDKHHSDAGENEHLYSEERHPWSHYANARTRFSAEELVAQIRSFTVRDSKPFIEWIAPIVRLEPQTVERKLVAWRGHGCLQTVFADRWPIDIATPPRDMLGSLAARPLGRSPSLVRWIADIAGVAPQEAYDRLANARGTTRVDAALPEILAHGTQFDAGTRTRTVAQPHARLPPDSAPSSPNDAFNRNEMGSMDQETTHDVTREWFGEFVRRANRLEGLSTTSSSKYDEFKEWLGTELTVTPAVCFLSEVSKQWTPRVGQALMGMPTLLVLLMGSELPVETAERLATLHHYVTGLHASIVLVGEEGAWSVALVSGTPGRALYDRLSTGVPESVQSTARSAEVDSDEPASRSASAGDFMELIPTEQGDLIWSCLIGRGAVEFDEAIRAAANELRDDGMLEFERLRRDGPIYAAVENAIAWCTRRGILFDRPRRGCVRAVLANAGDFKREHWRDCVMKAIGESADWMDRDDLVRSTADMAIETYGLDMQRLRIGGRTDTGIRSAINGLIRTGVLERQGGRLLRRSQGQGSTHPPGNVDAPPAEIESTPISAIPSSAVVSEGPLSSSLLRAMVGEVPGEAEAVFMQLVATPLKSTEELHAAVTKHLKDFEDAFEVHEFLDLNGAEKLAAESRRFLELWPTFSAAEKHLAQAAILYFVESEEADDDFRIGGLRTDKLVLEAVKRAVVREPTAP